MGLCYLTIENPDPLIAGRGGGGRSQDPEITGGSRSPKKKNFSTLRASVWATNMEGGLGPPLLTDMLFPCPTLEPGIKIKGYIFSSFRL